MANANRSARPVVSPEDTPELARLVADAHNGKVVDLLEWLDRRLDAAREAEPSEHLDPEDLADHDAAAAEAEDDLRNGRCVTAEQYLAGVRPAG